MLRTSLTETDCHGESKRMEITINLREQYLRVEDPASLFSLLPHQLKKRLLDINVEYLEKSDEELEALVKPPASLRMLKFRLWDSYNRNLETLEQLSYDEICRGICTPAYLTRAISRNPAVVAWLTTPPRKYELAAEEALMFGLDRIREILAFPLWTSEGKPDTKTAALILNVMKMLDLRVKGSPIQKHEIRQHTLQVHANVKDAQTISMHTSMDEIESRLRKLRGEEEKHELLEDARPKLELFKTNEVPVEVPVDYRERKEEF